MKHLTCLLLITFLLSSCISGSFKGLYGYYNKTRSESPNLIVEPEFSSRYNLCSINYTDSTKIFVVNGIELRKCISNFDHAVLFIWKPNCHSQFCYSLNAVQQLCRDKNIELYIVAEYYDSKKMETNYILKRPIYGVNTKYYRTNLTARYLEKFLQDIAGVHETSGNFLRFRNGKFMESFQDIDNL